MSNVLTIFTEYFNKKGLKRIRFKVDPTLKDGFDIAKTYEGFILKESDEGVSVIYIPAGAEMGMHDMEGILPLPEPDRLGPIKDKIAEILQDRAGREYLPQIMNSNCFMEIEQYLRNSGMNSEDIIELLKRVITNEATSLPPITGTPTSAPTGIGRGLSAIGRGLKGVAKLPGKILRAPAKAGEKLSKWKRKADAATRYLKTFEPGYLERDTPRWVANPNLQAGLFTRDREFMDWYNDKYDMKGNTANIVTILNNASVNQLNYWARKFYESTGKYIS